MKSSNLLLVITAAALCGCGAIWAAQQADTENSQLNNPKPQNCGVDIDVPEWLVVNDNDENSDEIWDFDIEPIAGETNTVLISITATADKSPATVTVEITTGQDKIEGFWGGTLTIPGQPPEGSEQDGKEKKTQPSHSTVVR